jgi:hypothetical protein
MARAKSTTSQKLEIYDPVFSRNSRLKRQLGHVVGFGVDPTRWVRVETLDGKVRIWARENLALLSPEEFEFLRDEYEVACIEAAARAIREQAL